MSRKTNYTTIPSGYVSFYIMDGNGNDVNGNNATSDNAIWVSSTAGYGVQELSWGSSTTFTYSSITYTNSYLIKNGQVIKNSSEVSSTALNGINEAYYQGLLFYNRTLSNSEELAIQQYASRKFGPTRGLKNNGIFVGSLPNLEQGKVFEISKPQVGGTYYDQTGNGYNGTATNVTDSTIGQANVMSFDGSSSQITVPSGVINGNTISVSVWAQLNGTISDTDGKILDLRDGNGYTFLIKANIYNNVNKFGFYVNFGTSKGMDIIPFDNIYHHFVLTVSNGNANFYNNGILVGTTSGVGTNSWSNSDGRIGQEWNNGATRYFSGNILLPTIYNRLLSPEEIQQLYYLQKGNFIN